MLTDPTGLLLVIVAIVALAFGLERWSSWCRRVGASLMVIVIAALVANLGLVTARSPVYDLVGGPVTSLAIVWLLLAVDLRDLRRAGPRMLGAFALAVAGTATGALLAYFVAGPSLGDDGWRLAGVMTGTYAGGGLNFVAVGRAVGLEDVMFTAATAADNVLTAAWIGITLVIPVASRIGRPATSPTVPVDGMPEPPLPVDDPSPPPFRLFDVAALTAIGLALVLVADRLAATWTAVPSVVWLTSLALAVSLWPAVRRLHGAMVLGLIALHLFFVIIGFGSRIAEIARVGPQVFVFTAIVVTVHGLVVFGLGRLLGLDRATSAVASQAAVGGPSTAMALAAARGWHSLAAPGMMVGLLGYAVGTYAGLAIAAFTRGLGG